MSKRWEQSLEIEIREWTTIENMVDEEFEELKNKFSHALKELESKLSINDNTKILDVGCGPTCASKLLSKGIRTGIDPLAKTLGYEKQDKDISVITGKAENMPFSNDEFDIVLCINALDHMDEPIKALKEMQRVLKPTGFLILACYTYNPFITFIKRFCEITGFKRNIEHPHTYSPQNLRKIVGNYFKIMEDSNIHTGMSPIDYGKTKPIEDQNPFYTKLVLFFNYKIFGFKYFVKEILLVGKKLL